MNGNGSDPVLFSAGTQYYVAGRLGVFAQLDYVVGNLFHRAIEMYLKGALSKTKSLAELERKFRHKLPKIWEAFKGQTNDAVLNRFDATIANLHCFEEIRYPDSILAKGMKAAIDLVRCNAAATTAKPSEPEYRICVQDIDELVEAIFSAASRNPKVYLSRYLRGPMREFLIKENKASTLTTT